MKCIFAFLSSIIFCCGLVSAKEPMASISASLASQSLLLDIVYVEQSTLVAVGEHGHILFSTDAKHWQQAAVPIQSTLTSVFFVNAELGWAVGHDSSILHSKDGGQTWTIQQYKPELEKPLLDIFFKNPLQGVAVGAYGQFFRTNDGGESWQSEFHDEFLFEDDIEYLMELKNEDEAAYLDEIASILPHFNRIVLDGSTAYLVGEIGLMAKSNDFGVSWQKFDEIYQGSFFDLTKTGQGNLLVVGLRGNVFRSLKNSESWKRSKTETTALLNSIVLGDDNRIFLLGNNGVLLESNDDGQTFFPRNQKDGKPLIAGVWFKNQIVEVSDGGIKNIVVTKSGTQD